MSNPHALFQPIKQSSVRYETKKEEIHAFSLDFDGTMDKFAICLRRKKIHLEETMSYAKWEKEFKEQFFINQLINKCVNTGKKVILLNGSNRQNEGIDLINRWNYYDKFKCDAGSCLAFLDEFKKWLNKMFAKKEGDIEFDRFLLPDLLSKEKKTERKEEIKTTYQRAMDDQPYTTNFARSKEELFSIAKQYNKGPLKNLKDTGYDPTKISLLYAQIHKLARENQGKNVVFHFCDDNSDIIFILKEAFKKNPHLLPANVKLQMYLVYPSSSATIYEKSTKPYVTIQGEGPVLGENQCRDNTNILYEYINSLNDPNKDFSWTEENIKLAIAKVTELRRDQFPIPEDQIRAQLLNILPRYKDKWWKRHKQDVANLAHLFDVDEDKVPQRKKYSLTHQYKKIKDISEKHLDKKIGAIEDIVLNSLKNWGVNLLGVSEEKISAAGWDKIYLKLSKLKDHQLVKDLCKLLNNIYSNMEVDSPCKNKLKNVVKQMCALNQLFLLQKEIENRHKAFGIAKDYINPVLDSLRSSSSKEVKHDPLTPYEVLAQALKDLDKLDTEKPNSELKSAIKSIIPEVTYAEAEVKDAGLRSQSIRFISS